MRLVDLRPAVAVVLLFLMPLRAGATVSFSTTEDVELIGVENPQAIVLGDLNGDNFDDLVTVNDFDGVTVLLNDGEGELFFDTDYETVFDGAPVAVVVGLFNSDQIPDIAAANSLANTVSVLLGIGDGEFDDEEAPFQVQVGDRPIGIGVGDFNNDLRVDLAVLSSNLVYLLQNNGDGTFSAFNPATVDTFGGDSYAIAVGLLNADSNLDLAVTNRGAGQVVTFLGAGDGTFTVDQFLSVGSAPTGIIIADADGDLDNDLLVVDSEAQLFDEVRLLLNSGSPPLFGLPQSIVSGEGPLAITGLDIEPDGKLDIAVTTVMVGPVSLLCQPSDKCNVVPPGLPLEADLFRPPDFGTVPGCSEEGQVAIVSGKLNDDDMDDLVALSGDLDTLCISLNTSTTGTPAPVTPATPTPTPTGPTPTPTETRTFTPTPTATEVPTIGLGVCNTEQGLPSVNLGRPVAVASEDFDRDGDLDVAVADSTGNRVVIVTTNLSSIPPSMMPCNALGLQEGSTFNVMGPRALVTDDFDRDGSFDLAVIGEQGLSLFFGDGSGGFAPSAANPMPAGSDPSSFDVTDFNRDFTPDLIVSDSGSQSVSIFLGTRQQSQPFTGRCPLGVGRMTNAVEAVDLNADGRPDIAVSSLQGPDVGVFVQVPNAPLACESMAVSFQGQSAIGLPDEPVGLVAGVFTTNDNIPDLVVAMRDSSNGGTVVLLEGRAAGGGGVTYQQGTPVALPTPEEGGARSVPMDIGTGDLERDGLVDLVLTDSQNNTLVEFRGQSSGGLGVGLDPLLVEGVGPADLVVVDLDRDGRDDVIIANPGDGSVSYLISSQRAETPTPPFTMSPTATPTLGPPTPTITLSPTITPTPTRSRRPTASLTPEPTHTQRGVISLSGNGCTINYSGDDSGTFLLGSFAFLALMLRRRAVALLRG